MSFISWQKLLTWTISLFYLPAIQCVDVHGVPWKQLAHAAAVGSKHAYIYWDVSATLASVLVCSAILADQLLRAKRSGCNMFTCAFDCACTRYSGQDLSELGPRIFNMSFMQTSAWYEITRCNSLSVCLQTMPLLTLRLDDVATLGNKKKNADTNIIKMTALISGHVLLTMSVNRNKIGRKATKMLLLVRYTVTCVLIFSWEKGEVPPVSARGRS